MAAWIWFFAFIAVLAFWTLTLMGASDRSRELRVVKSRNVGLRCRIGQVERDNVELRRLLLLEKAKSNPPEIVPVHLRPRRPFIIGTDKGARP